jgi:hypothetical protein
MNLHVYEGKFVEIKGCVAKHKCEGLNIDINLLFKCGFLYFIHVVI